MPDQTSSYGGRQRVDGYTLFMRKSIHDASGNGYQRSPRGMNPIVAPSREHAPNQGAIYTTSSHSHPNGKIKLEVPWIDVHTLVVL